MPTLPLQRPHVSHRSIAVVASAAALLSVVAVTVPARADSLKHRIASAQAQLSALDAKAEAASERFNAARIKLAGDHQKATQAQAELAKAQAVLDRVQQSVQRFAVEAYQGQATDEGMVLTSESPQEFIEKASTLQAVANSQSQALAELAAAQHAQAQARATATAALAAQQSSTAQMQADRASIVSAAHQEERILKRMQAREAAIIKAAKARAAKLAAERAAAALAQRVAAAQTAAAALYSQPTTSPVVHGSGGASTAVRWAYRELGKPYQWGAAGPNSFDCSGLTQYVWGKAGVYLAHYTGDQWNEGQHVSRSQLEPGDLVFFGSDLHHVGLYIGHSDMIEAPYTGADVRISYAFRPDYAGAIRPGT